MGMKEVASAIAYFERSDDLNQLLEVLRAIRPRAAASVRRFESRNAEVPAPLEMPRSGAPASREAALRTVRETNDFAQLQALSRAIGRRIEELQQPGTRE